MPQVCIPGDVVAENGLCYVEQQMILHGAVVGCPEEPVLPPIPDCWGVCNVSLPTWYYNIEVDNVENSDVTWQVGPCITTNYDCGITLMISFHWDQDSPCEKRYVARINVDNGASFPYVHETDVPELTDVIAQHRRNEVVIPIPLTAGPHTVCLEYKRAGSGAGDPTCTGHAILSGWAFRTTCPAT